MKVLKLLWTSFFVGAMWMVLTSICFTVLAAGQGGLMYFSEKSLGLPTDGSPTLVIIFSVVLGLVWTINKIMKLGEKYG